MDVGSWENLSGIPQLVVCIDDLGLNPWVLVKGKFETTSHPNHLSTKPQTGLQPTNQTDAECGEPRRAVQDQPWKRWWQEKRQKDVALLNAAEAIAEWQDFMEIRSSLSW